MNDTALNIHLAPLLPQFWLIALIIIAAVLMALAFWRHKNGIVLRIITFCVFILALLNPSVLKETRESVKDVAVIVVDQSPSQKFGDRTEKTAEALAHLKNEIEKNKNIELRIVEAPAENKLTNETQLFEALERTLADVPESRRAGVIFLSDGQIHDVPPAAEPLDDFGPVHTLLTGKRGEKDRQLVIVQAPAYGITGQSVTLKYKVQDTKNINQALATVTLKTPDGPPQIFAVPPGEEQTIELPINHAGQNVFELGVQTVDGEITESNNRAGLIVNGVRDRLRVLLVSGKPHAGGRTWRDLLTSDPGVDLVHFTILREPDKLDSTPQDELSLIAFPFRELFEIKLYDFDLIIFDQYRLNRILPSNYFTNIVKYVEDGGALLEASGPSFATEDSVYFTSLMNVLPGAPRGDVLEEPFKPALTDKGRRHPVTKDLTGQGTDPANPAWGNWLRHVSLNRQSGDTLMNGAENMPLLILDRVKEGRVAQIGSDHVWLWSRGYDGGGPHAELLRRIVHWLMKEPELDEKALHVSVDEQHITLIRENYERGDSKVVMIKPDSTQELLELEESADGTLHHELIADQLGVYTFEDMPGQKYFAVVGDLNPKELSAVVTSEVPMTPVAEKSKGGVLWLSESPAPKLRFIDESRHYAGKNWIGLRENRSYNITGVEDRPAMPEWAWALLLLALITVTWWRESKAE